MSDIDKLVLNNAVNTAWNAAIEQAKQLVLKSASAGIANTVYLSVELEKLKK